MFLDKKVGNRGSYIRILTSITLRNHVLPASHCMKTTSREYYHTKCLSAYIIEIRAHHNLRYGRLNELNYQAPQF